MKVLFVCLGNICRSPMAQYIFEDLIEKKGISDKFYIDSAATSTEEKGNGIYYGASSKLKQMHIKIGNHVSRQITAKDYDEFDYILGMEESNIKNIKRIVGKDKDNKIHKLLDFTRNPRDIADPWYTGNFDKTYDDIVEGLNGFMEYLEKRDKI